MRERMNRFITREKATTFADVLGAILVSVGIYLMLGLGAGIFTAGICILIISYLVA